MARPIVMSGPFLLFALSLLAAGLANPGRLARVRSQLIVIVTQITIIKLITIITTFVFLSRLMLLFRTVWRGS